MTSFSTAGAGVKAVTQIQPGKRGYNQFDPTQLGQLACAIEVVYIETSLATVLDVSGSGYLAFSAFQALATSTAALVKVTIDGVIVLNDTDTDIANFFMIQAGAARRTSSDSGVSREQVIFTQSLKVEVSCSREGRYYYDYYLN